MVGNYYKKYGEFRTWRSLETKNKKNFLIVLEVDERRGDRDEHCTFHLFGRVFQWRRFSSAVTSENYHWYFRWPSKKH